MTDVAYAELVEIAKARGAVRKAEEDAHDPPMAPFSSWPGAPGFDVIGRCRKCGDVEQIGEFYVRLAPRPAPAVAWSKGMYCRTCMLFMGVGSDSTLVH